MVFMMLVKKLFQNIINFTHKIGIACLMGDN